MYVEEGVEGEYDFEEEYRQLSFYSIKDGGKIYVRPLQWINQNFHVDSMTVNI